RWVHWHAPPTGSTPSIVSLQTHFPPETRCRAFGVSRPDPPHEVAEPNGSPVPDSQRGYWTREAKFPVDIPPRCVNGPLAAKVPLHAAPTPGCVEVENGGV